MTDQHTQYGFTYGPMEVERTARVDRGHGLESILCIKTAHRELHVYCSPKGRSLRVFRDGKELRA